MQSALMDSLETAGDLPAVPERTSDASQAHRAPRRRRPPKRVRDRERFRQMTEEERNALSSKQIESAVRKMYVWTLLMRAIREAREESEDRAHRTLDGQSCRKAKTHKQAQRH